MKPIAKIVLLSAFILALTGIMMGVYMYNKPHKDIRSVKPDYVIKAEDLQKEFGANESAASAKYLNKIVEVTGTITYINANEEKILSITLKTGDQISSVICSPGETIKPGKLTPGRNVTVRGEMSGYLMDVVLNNCVIINK